MLDNCKSFFKKKAEKFCFSFPTPVSRQIWLTTWCKLQYGQTIAYFNARAYKGWDDIFVYTYANNGNDGGAAIACESGSVIDIDVDTLAYGQGITLTLMFQMSLFPEMATLRCGGRWERFWWPVLRFLPWWRNADIPNKKGL